MDPWNDISQQIATITQRKFFIKEKRLLTGGCISQSFRISNGTQIYFVKLNSRENLAIFDSEADGLNEIQQSKIIRIPNTICVGHNAQSAWLVLEYVALHSEIQSSAQKLGTQLAAMHRITAKQYGWKRDNFIGSTPQINTWSHNWIRFWQEKRLSYQLKLAAQNGYGGKLQVFGERLLTELEHFFQNRQPPSSLLHGDLWQGNYAFDSNNNPILFDPAVYFGDRETDIAMTELFGGFSPAFYSAYQNDYPLDSGYNMRKIIYNLYHILNHLNLFGNSYRPQAEHMMATLLAEVRS
ncbi:fructosamine-3-kinase [Nitrosomonas sp. PY1]|uniref:fructosamine kinase family protein n=1 Tax=Nitrosomonas sp. PY1 TaxID=1803906 RepID=UPI001FC8C037|nr:fructosamine kinase family protein [Nitrosomonas sp. PY1]GKS69253.1 fructosamine-3-kinase [Nitrosomonas sp. PY1]